MMFMVNKGTHLERNELAFNPPPPPPLHSRGYYCVLLLLLFFFLSVWPTAISWGGKTIEIPMGGGGMGKSGGGGRRGGRGCQGFTKEKNRSGTAEEFRDTRYTYFKKRCFHVDVKY